MNLLVGQFQWNYDFYITAVYKILQKKFVNLQGPSN